MIREESKAAALRGYLGDRAFDEYAVLAVEHLAPGDLPNVLFVPGVMDSLLDNLQKAGVWWIDVRARQHLNGLALNPAGDADQDPSDQIRAFNVDISYEPFLTELTRTRGIGHRMFPYDWRKDLSRSSAALVEAVNDMRQRNGGQPVNLVGHSMGGLMIRTALRDHPELWDLIDKVVFIGTPHYGSPAITTYLKNHFWGFDAFVVLGLYLSRPTLRSMWGVLEMLPAPFGVYPGTRPGESWLDEDGHPGHPTANFDQYKVDDYKLDDLEGDPLGQATRLQSILDHAAANHASLAAAHDALSHQQRQRMLTIAGVGEKTVFRLEYTKGFFGHWERAKKVTSEIDDDPHRVGDGRVPLASATLPDVAMRYVKGVHGNLTNIPAVIHDVLAFLRGKSLSLPATPGEALAEHLAAGDRPLAPGLNGSSLYSTAPEGHVADADLWNESPPAQQRIDEIIGLLDADKLPEFRAIRML